MPPPDAPAATKGSSLAQASFLRACALDVAVRKPGNVSMASPGHRMHAAQFISSAAAAAGPLCAPGASVGQRIEGAVAATWDAVACNTNLGIVLLCAPIAAAAERRGALVSRAGLQQAVEAALQDLTVDDARGAFSAITRANPGGLGRAAAQDVRDQPGIGLRQAMALAAERDSIARQYSTGYADLFALDWPELPASIDPRPPDAALTRGVQRLFLRILASWPDSHIVRKHGPAAAQIVSAQAAAWLDHGQPDLDPAFARWDLELKQQALNPGTSADLTVATLMLASLVGGAAAPWHGS